MSLGRVDAEDIRYFFALSQAGTLVRAADDLGVDHTTVSRRVQRLERAAGRKLFTRSRQGWALTEAGKRLLPAARNVAVGADVFAGAEDSLPFIEEVTVFASEGFAAYVLAPHADDLLSNDGYALKLLTAPSLASRDGISYDVAILRSELVDHSTSTQLLASYEVGLYATKDYLYSHPPIESLEDLEGHHISWYPEDPIAGIPEVTALRSKLPRTLTLQSNNLFVHQQATLAGTCLGMIATYMADYYPQLQRLLPEDLSYFGNYWTVIPATQRRHGATQKALDFINHAVAQLGIGVEPIHKH